VRAHPVDTWPAPTRILYADQDHLTDRQTVDSFVSRFGCDLTVMEGGEHWFHTPEQLNILNTWMIQSLNQLDGSRSWAYRRDYRPICENTIHTLINKAAWMSRLAPGPIPKNGWWSNPSMRTDSPAPARASLRHQPAGTMIPRTDSPAATNVRTCGWISTLVGKNNQDCPRLTGHQVSQPGWPGRSSVWNSWKITTLRSTRAVSIEFQRKFPS